MKKFCLFVFMCIAFISCNKNLPSNENEISAPDDPEAFFDDQKIEKRPVEYPPLSEYFFNEKENCYIINNVIRFPKIQNARMVDRSHMSRGYDGVRADKNVLTMEYNGSLISVIIICPYHNTSVQDFLFFNVNPIEKGYYEYMQMEGKPVMVSNIKMTKGFYEYGDAMDALRDRPFELNSENIRIKSFMNSNEKKGYIFLDEISKTYDFTSDIYESFYIIISSDGDDKILSEYYNLVKDKIKYQ